MLRIYFNSQGYEVFVANQGQDALNICRTRSLGIIIFGVSSPDSDSYQVYSALSSNIRTRHIPFVFLIHMSGQERKISELKLNTEDVVVSPFNIEKLREHIERKLHGSLTHPVTNLSTMKLIEEQLNIAKHVTEHRLLLYCNIRRTAAATPLAENEILISLAGILYETIETYGGPNDFIGQSSDNDFLVITGPQAASTIRDMITQRFNEQMGQSASLSWRQVNL